MTLAEQFRVWALDPLRSNDELFTVELLLEEARTVWGRKHQDYEHCDWDTRQAQVKHRKLNPAYRPRLDPARFDLAVEIWADLKRLYGSHSDDRPVRDLSALRFLPHLEEIAIDSELSDLGPVAALRGLKSLQVRDPELADLGALAGLPALEKVSLRLGVPWPVVASLGTLPALKELEYHGNLLALREVPALPAVETAALDGGWGWTPLRDLHEAPAMPRVRRLTVGGVASLRGVGRNAEVRRLDVGGVFKDLGPLTELGAVSILTLRGERFFDLAPLARLPQLRQLVLDREHGLDLTPLVDAPRLGEVKADRCKVLATELASINAILRPSDEEFVAAEPRVLPAWRTFVYDPRSDELPAVRAAMAQRCERVAAFGDDPVSWAAESDWYGRTVRPRLDALLGGDWGDFRVWSVGDAQVVLPRAEDRSRCGEIAKVLLAVSAAARFSWECRLRFEANAERDGDVWFVPRNEKERLERDLEEARERRDRWREKDELLEREHRLRLRQEQGLPVDPADFAPPDPAGDDAGEVEEAAEPDDEPAVREERSNFCVLVSESGLWVTVHDVAKARAHLPVAPQDWHALPEPPEQRPRPPGSL